MRGRKHDPCITCGRKLPNSAYYTPKGLRCIECWEAMKRRPCKCCGELTPMPAARPNQDRPRTYCDRLECQAVARKTARAVAVKNTQQRNRRRTTKTCAACHKVKPLTEFRKAGRDRTTGEPLRYSYCKPCAKADERQRYLTDEVRREKCRARAKAQRDRINAQRAADPDFDREYRARAAKWARDRNRQKREEQERLLAEGDSEAWALAQSAKGGSDRRLLAQPLAVAIARRAMREERSVEDMCAAADTDPRNYLAWRTGERQFVNIGIADRVMLALGLLWFDVYTEDEWPEAHAAAEGVFG